MIFFSKGYSNLLNKYVPIPRIPSIHRILLSWKESHLLCLSNDGCRVDTWDYSLDFRSSGTGLWVLNVSNNSQEVNVLPTKLTKLLFYPWSEQSSNLVQRSIDTSRWSCKWVFILSFNFCWFVNSFCLLNYVYMVLLVCLVDEFSFRLY